MNDRLTILREKANNLPLEPGVYIMSNADGEVIYVGKAKKLKNRVSSYFRGAHNAKVTALVDKVYDFNVIYVKSEFEALMLENALIKKHQPHYNILLKDDKGYPFVTLNTKEDFPRFKISNKKSGKTFGPYGGRSLTRDILVALEHALKLPDCSVQFPQDRPCLNKQMGLCEGWCVNGDKENYARRIQQACMILEGESAELIASLWEKMLAAADELQFETAAALRDRIRSIENLQNKERVTSGWAERNLPLSETDDNEAKYKKSLKSLSLLGSFLGLENTPNVIEAFDVSNLGDSGIVAAMTCFQDAKPYKKGYRKFRIKDMPVRDDYSSMYQAVFRRFRRYTEGDANFSRLPDLLLIDGGRNHAATAEQALKELGLEIPVFGMVKDDRHRTRALVSSRGEEIGIASNQSVYALIGRIQEETHRFAIEYQRSLRYENFGSELDGIPGVGEKRKAELLQHFRTIKAIREAELAALTEAVPSNVAKAVYTHFHGGEK